LEDRGRSRRFTGEFFNEFVVEAPDVADRWERVCTDTGIIPGFPLGRWYPELAGSLLVCVTEVHDEPHVKALLDTLGTGGQHDVPERRRA
jgi:glycine dehydrogenase subunit 1